MSLWTSFYRVSLKGQGGLADSHKRCDGSESSKVSIHPFIDHSPTYPVLANDAILTNPIGIVSYPNVKEANTTHKISQLESVAASRDLS